jgi:hypothetical protein
MPEDIREFMEIKTDILVGRWVGKKKPEAMKKMPSYYQPRCLKCDQLVEEGKTFISYLDPRFPNKGRLVYHLTCFTWPAEVVNSIKAQIVRDLMLEGGNGI